MIYLIEGPDGAGKTTLANQLVDMSDGIYSHYSYPSSPEEAAKLPQYYLEALALMTGFSDQFGINYVVDRMWPSTIVYGDVLRGGSEVTLEQADKLEEMLEGRGCIIYCTGSPNTLWKKCQERGEDYIKDYSDFLRICQLYDQYMYETKHRVPVLTYEVRD